MNGLERVVAAVGHQPVDATPVMPVLLMQGARMLGLPLSTYFGKPDRIADGQLRLLERFDADAVYAFPHIVQDVLPWGSQIDLHDDGPPSVRGMIVREHLDAARLVAPDPTRHPYTRGTLATAERLARAVKGERLIVGAVIGPFSLPSMLMGTRKFLEVLLDPELRRTVLAPLLEVTLAYSTRWAQAQLDAGCDLVVVAEGIASRSIVDEDTFLRDALPVLRRFVGGVRGLVALEPVGHGEPLLPHVRDLGLAAVLLGESDGVVASRRALGGATAIVGTINNLKLLRWTPERIEFEGRRLIAEAGPGFVLANQGPEVPFDVPDASIEALVRAARSARALSRA